MTEQTLLNYVGQVYNLESEQYTLIQIINSLKNEHSRYKRMLLEENIEYTPPQEASIPGSAKVKIGVGIAWILIVICSMGQFMGKLSGDSSFFAAMMVHIAIGAFLIWNGYKSITRTEEANEQRKRKAEETVERRIKEIKEQNGKIRIICGQCESAISEFEQKLTEKETVLETMYGYDIIHRSYRNFYGISKIYHLLDTGICDSLTGVNGAYSQMRTDQIIDNQKISIELQKSLLATNQMMYNAINKTNDLLGTMNQQINIQNTNNTQLLQDIRNNVEVSKFLIQSGNDDRKALAASAEYLAYAEKQKRLADGHFY